ncbi:MAG: tetratricopeptide repeat protein [Dongiaceae bacterium]
MERKLAAILAADIAGYSRLMGVDEEKTLNALRAHRDIVDRLIAIHHGRVFNTAGDSIVAEFPSAVEATHCAVEIQQEIAKGNETVPTDKRLEFRIGLNIGDVMAEDGNMFGDGVNVADRVQKLATAGGICASRNIYEQVKNKVGVTFESIGQHHVKNIAEPLSVYRVLAQGASARPLAIRWLFAIRRHGAVAITLVAMLMIVAGGTAAWRFYPRALPPSGPPRIAVLPFNNMSGDAALDYFSDGISESIISMLARYPDLLVTARSTSFTYKGKSVDIRQVGKELNVSYVLEGSVQKSGDKVRIIAQLIETATGEHVWADRFDEEGSDPLALQDQVTEKIIAALGGHKGQVQKAEYEQAWGKDTASLGEYDYLLRSHDFYFRFTEKDMARAREIIQEGLQKFPNSSLLHVKLGWTYFMDWWNGWGDSLQEARDKAFKLAQEGLAAPNPTPMVQWYGHWLMANTLLYYKRDPDRALAEAKAAKAMAPYDPDTLADLARILIYAGETDEAIAWLKEALRRNPEDWHHNVLSYAYIQKGEYQLAIDEAAKCDDCAFYKYWNQMTSYYRLGRMDEARQAAAEMRKLNANFTVTVARNDEEFFKDPASTARELDELRKMGFPEN